MPNKRYRQNFKVGGKVTKPGKASAKKFPDLTGDGKVTRADILKGRGAFRVGGLAKAGKKAYDLYKSRVGAMNKKIKSGKGTTATYAEEYGEVLEAEKKGIKTKKDFKKMQKEKAEKRAKEYKGLPEPEKDYPNKKSKK